MHPSAVEIETLYDLELLLDERRDLAGVVLNGLDLDLASDQLLGCQLRGAVLIGCSASPELLAFATWSGAAVFPGFGGLPYRPYRRALYSADELYDAFDPNRPGSYDDTFDALVYAHWKRTPAESSAPISSRTWGRRIHDYSITDAVESLIDGAEVVAIMGGTWATP